MSNGDRVEKSVIDHRVRDAKIEKLKIQVLEEDYVYCKEIGYSIQFNSGDPS